MAAVALGLAILGLLLWAATTTVILVYAWKWGQEIQPLLRLAEGTMKERAYQALGPQHGIPPAPVSEDWTKYMNRFRGAQGDNSVTDVRQADPNPWDADEHIDEAEHTPAPGSKAAQAPPG